MTSSLPADLELDPQRKTICLYHNDPDGCCAAAIVRRAFGEQLRLHAMEIGARVPWSSIEKAKQVVLVDYSLSPSDMVRLKEDWGFVWIDHHKTALRALGHEMQVVPGIRSLEEAACVLTWQTFFPDTPVPYAVKLIGDRDIWRNALEDTRAFNEGLYAREFDPAAGELWKPLLDDDLELVGELTQRGEILYQARMRQIKNAVDERGFETVFEGHRTLAINHRGTGDMGEYIRQAGYTIGYCYAETLRAGRLQTIVTLYSDQIDVSDIARKHGGGGHAGAAGFQFDRSDRPFPPGSEGPAR